MSITKSVHNAVKSIQGELYSALPVQGITCPVFIVGCGRSGTTILGKTLSKHKKVTYLHEPRRLWSSAYPETDIWTSRAPVRKGKLVLTAADADERKSRKLKRLFRLETLRTKKPVLIEKLPINTFRLKLLSTIFPDARFIHIYRNGLEVARSIQQARERGSWFGADSYKWKKLVEYALSRAETSALPKLVTSHFDMGLLEWRLSTEAAVEFLSCLTDDIFLELSYDELVQNPVRTISRVLRFVGLHDDRNVKKFACDEIKRKTGQLIPATLSRKEKIIGGKLLPLSMEGGKRLTRRCEPTPR
jgi:Sulfotransferase family